jgi:uncharacterized protein HemX
MPEPGFPNDDRLARGTPRRSRRALWVWLALLLGTAAVGYWYVLPKVEAWWAGLWADDAAATAGTGQATAGTSAAATEDPVDALARRIDTRQGNAESALAGLRSSVAQLQMQVTSSNTGEARLAEVEHLLNMARVHAELEGEPRTALRLLGAADALMADSGDPRYLGTRAALDNDLAKVRVQAAIDVEGTYVRLSQLARTVPQLPLRQPVYTPDPATPAPASGDFWSGAMDSLRGLVRVRTDRATDELPVLTLEGQALVRERMMLALDQAASAALHGQATVYREALGRANALVQQNARPEHVATQRFRQALAGLATAPIAREAVAITAIGALQQIPRMQAPGLLPPPEALGLPAGPPLDGVAQMLPVPAAVPAEASSATPPSGASR